MKTLSAPEIFKVTVHVVLFIILSGTLVGAGLGQTTSKSLTPEEQELLKAQKANEEAQAEYYREQTNKLRQPPPTPTPGKTFSQSVAENPASVVGVVGTILGAIIVALVSLTTLYYNSRNAIRAQLDFQFYEAMKRMGDKDSATLRASAAGILALMAQRELQKLSPSKKWPYLNLQKSKPYFETAVDQLMVGHLLETNPVATESIKNALQQLVPLAPDNIIAITRDLYAANLSLQDELASLMAEFFVIRNCRQLLDLNEAEEQGGLWEQIAAVTGFETRSLRKLARHSPYFENRFWTYRHIIDAQSTGDRGELLSALHDKLQVASGHLRANVHLLCTALEKLGSTERPAVLLPFDRAFLVDGMIRHADLSDLHFAYANLSGLYLYDVNLANTSLFSASLQGVLMVGGSLCNSFLSQAEFERTQIVGVDMTEAHIAEAKIPTGLTCAWWKADFTMNDKVDDALLESFYQKDSQSVPTDLKEVHDSVRPFIESKRALESELEKTMQE